MDRINICTSCGDKDLFSYRASNGHCGRQLAFIGF
jgi:copper oxidase (laccase) domain-containing protein